MLREWRGDASVARACRARPSARSSSRDAPDRPQPRRDVDAGRGMTVVVGRVRADPQLDLQLVALGHNTIRGAAGGSVLNAELLVATGVVGRA